ncbi:UvrD-helicase domain-containing protein [Pseudomonas rhodesiae]|uniref:DNA 3'-5' helicase II n=1 Tax=Pseudomonas rhodesiae TaxID=76760 RepID=A0AAE8HFH2_9PSED|nr:UvrD-helicase domain-containing protein [Pseudomonas rhodesiae]TWR54591.1 superfamily I DNA/RNA helicase [Pseudomonas rhodesiae]SDV13865.1 UvrD-like helicase C-terminal domain-containing protein [Pseudomonas rhodesiae]
MNNNWWRSKKEMDQAQKDFIRLPVEGRYLLSGPPGSGKTNLLLLRAEVMVGSGEKDILFITFTRSLADFIRSGAVAKGFVKPDQIRTFHSWAAEYVNLNLRQRLSWNDGEFGDDSRAQALEQLIAANAERQSEKMYSAIFVDEAQDLSVGELTALLELSDKVCVCGDDRQGIYHQDGMEIADRIGLDSHKLTKHFRIGQEIAKVADKLMPPPRGGQLLESSCNYDPALQGASSAILHTCDTRQHQLTEMHRIINIQLDAFPGEALGIFCPTQEDRLEIKEYFSKTELASRISTHGVDQDATFASDSIIHIMTLHASKGTEFRCVHIFGAEGLRRYPLRRTTLSYTGVTRAKTALNVYKTGDTTPKMESAFATPVLFGLDNLFPDD